MKFPRPIFAFLMVGLMAGLAFAQPWAIVSKASKAAGPPALTSLPITATGSGNLIVVGLIFNGTTSVSSISDNAGNTYVSGGAKAAVSNFTTEIWYAVSSKSGATSITPKFAGAPTNVEMTEWEVSGISTGAPDAANIACGSVTAGNTAGAAVTSTQAGDFVSSIMYGGAVTFTNTSSGNAFTDDFTTTGRGWAHLTSTTAAAGSYQPSWVTSTTPSGRYCSSTVAFKPTPVQAQASPINHVVVIVQENRSVDNLFGSNSPSNQYYLPGLNVSTTGKTYTIVNGVKQTSTVNLVPLPLASTLGSAGSITADDYDPNHAYGAFQDDCDAPTVTSPSTKCAMDGFNKLAVYCLTGATGCPGPKFPTYAYVQYSDVAPYFQMASQFGYANSFFQTNQGPSYPAHLFLFSGTSQPGNGPEPNWFVVSDVNNSGFNGCIASSGATVALVNPSTGNQQTTMFPCFNHETMADAMAAHVPPITWTYYNPGEGSIWTAPDSYESTCTPSNGNCTGPYWTKGATNGFVDVKSSDVLTDIGNCKLAQVDWVIPDALESDHASTTDGSGPSWVSSIVNKIGSSTCTDLVNGKNLTYWQDTAIIITWDDWGGWYDHVVPPPLAANAPANAASYVYGFRVPLIVVSAYTPAGTVSNVVGEDFGTILKFIEKTFGLPSIDSGSLGGFADSYAYGDLSEFFQFTQTPRAFKTIAAPIKEDVFLDPNRPMDPPDND